MFRYNLHSHTYIIRWEDSMKKSILVSLLALAVSVTPTAFASETSNPAQSSKTKTEETQLLLQFPLATDQYRVSADFSEKIDPETKVKTLHNGIDYVAPKGTSIVAANDGVVMFAGSLKGFGETIIIDHNSEFMTIYESIKPGSFLVKTGDSVKKGQKIAEVGSSESTGNQLHFTVYKQGKPVNPNDFLKQSSK